jgi:hypothetical protein
LPAWIVAGHRLGNHQRLPGLHGGADIAQQPQHDRILVIEQHPHQGDAVMAAGQRIIEKTAAIAARALAQRLPANLCGPGSATGGRSNSDSRSPDSVSASRQESALAAAHVDQACVRPKS